MAIYQSVTEPSYFFKSIWISSFMNYEILVMTKHSCANWLNNIEIHGHSWSSLDFIFWKCLQKFSGSKLQWFNCFQFYIEFIPKSLMVYSWKQTLAFRTNNWIFSYIQINLFLNNTFPNFFFKNKTKRYVLQFHTMYSLT